MVAMSGIDLCTKTTKLCSFSCLFLPVTAPALASEVERRVKKGDLRLDFSVSDFRMQKAATLVSLLVLGFSWTLQGLPAAPEPLHGRQENVDVERYKREAELGLDQPEGSGMEQPFFNGSEACKAAPDTGPCFGSFQNYFYNSSSMSCELFSYGGCLGNQNNFKDERDCLQRCRTEAVCRLPMLAQPCSGQPPIWAFDSSAGLCVPYKVGFCQNNANKFYSKAECEEYCGKTQDDGTEFLAAN